MKNAGTMREQAERQIEKYRKLVSSDPYRNRFHLMPPSGLLNDPNGLIEFNGRYHVFYQWNPFAVAHGIKYWGHYSTVDFVDWVAEPIALSPDQWYDKNGCFSGSAVVHEGRLYVFYTGNVRDEDGGRRTYQCLAVSEDGLHFEKKGPVIYLPEGYTSHFRDPKVWKDGDEWFMVLGAQTELSLDGQVVLYKSGNLLDWEFLGPVAGNGVPGFGEFGYMWECPDFFRLGGRDVLTVSPQGLEADGILYNNAFQSGYFSGKLGGEEPVFHPEKPFEELDRGFDFYAPQTMLDKRGRRILYAWMGMSDESQESQPTIDYFWVHALTSPRELFWRDGKLCQKPLEELEKLRTHSQAEMAVPSGKREESRFGLPESGLAELELQFSKPAAGKAFKLKLRNNLELSYDLEKERFTLGRRNFKDGSMEYRHCRLERLEKVHVFLDTSSVEVFLNGGEEVFTARFFAESGEREAVLRTDAGLRLECWELRPFGMAERETQESERGEHADDRHVL